jgi:peptidoglycan/LPS O-acetylase OafA/YrhL
MPAEHMKYRPDIDGLRAIAVVAVLGFHAAPAFFPGGFVGVDIFFVISGYLITGLIAADLTAGKFTLRRFYGRRIRRIFPALAAVLAASLLVAWICLLPDEWRQFGKHLFAGAAFVSNVALAREGGYFEWSAHFKPLLHLWSLGVEEQFYFVWPLFLAALWRAPRSGRVVILTTAVLASFLLNIAAIDRYPAYTFYLPFTRLWELGLGSWLALSPRIESSLRGRKGELAGWTGIALLGASIVMIRESERFPGFWALLPTIGTALLIAAGRDARINRLVLSNRAVVFVGLISYPLYLWHWPALSFLRIWHGGVIDAPATLLALLLSALLAWATFRWIEVPIRSRPFGSLPLRLTCGAMIVLAAVGAGVATQRIAPRLSNPDIAAAMAAADDWTYPFGDNFGRKQDFVLSTVPGTEPRAVLFVGDSHLEQYWPRIQFLTSGRTGPELRFATNGGCPPLPGLGRSQVCRRYLSFAWQAARDAKVTTVVFAAYWPVYLEDADDPQTAASVTNFAAEIRELVRRGKRVFVILASPASPTFDPRRRISRSDGRLDLRALPVRQFLSTAAPQLRAVREAVLAAGAEVIDPLPVLCREGICPAASPDGRPLYRDWSHMRPFYVRDRATYVDQVLE